MVMRRRILVTMGSAFTILVVALYLVSRVILLRSFTELERAYVGQELTRVENALSNEITALDKYVLDWAAWDDTYTFIENGDLNYIRSNLVDETFAGMELDLMVFVDAAGRIVYSAGFDSETRRKVPAPASIREHLTSDALLHHPTPGSSVHGLLMLPEGPLLVASRPILTSKEEGPIRGAVVMGRYLDFAEVRRLADVTYASATVRRCGDAQTPPDFQNACTVLTTTFPKTIHMFIQPLNENSVAAYTLIRDIYGQPGLVMRVDTSREIYRRGQTSMLYLVFLLLIGGLAFTGISSWLADRVVISRLVRLNADVIAIGDSGDPAARVPVTGDDELTSLASAINRMLAAVEQSEERLSTVHLLGRELVISRNVQQIAQAVVEAVWLLLPQSGCGLWLVDREQDALVCRACQLSGREISHALMPLSETGSITVSVARSGKSLYLPDAENDPRCAHREIGARSELCVPLTVEEEVIGVLDIINTRTDAFSEKDQRILATLADQAALAIGNALLYEQIRAARDRLQSLSNRLIEVQEEERRRIARELHDEIGQILTGLKLSLEMSLRLPSGGVSDGLRDALDLVNNLMARVRDLSLALRPTPLDDLGLLPALRWHVERYTAQTGIRVSLKHAGVEEQRFPQEVEIAAYRIVQESLTNVARHAQVKEVTVRLWADPATLSVQVEDQGVGFDAEAALSKGLSSGISGMRERVMLLGGQMSIESQQGGGARVTAEIPLSQE